MILPCSDFSLADTERTGFEDSNLTVYQVYLIFLNSGTTTHLKKNMGWKIKFGFNENFF